MKISNLIYNFCSFVSKDGHTYLLTNSKEELLDMLNQFSDNKLAFDPNLSKGKTLRFFLNSNIPDRSKIQFFEDVKPIIRNNSNYAQMYYNNGLDEIEEWFNSFYADLDKLKKNIYNGLVDIQDLNSDILFTEHYYTSTSKEKIRILADHLEFLTYDEGQYKDYNIDILLNLGINIKDVRTYLHNFRHAKKDGIEKLNVLTENDINIILAVVESIFKAISAIEDNE